MKILKTYPVNSNVQLELRITCLTLSPKVALCYHWKHTSKYRKLRHVETLVLSSDYVASLPHCIICINTTLFKYAAIFLMHLPTVFSGLRHIKH